MIVHKCDICGKEMESWLKVATYIEAMHNCIDVTNLSKLSGSYEICGDCFKAFIDSKESKNE